jgi:hypothetical protein
MTSSAASDTDSARNTTSVLGRAAGAASRRRRRRACGRRAARRRAVVPHRRHRLVDGAGLTDDHQHVRGSPRSSSARTPERNNAWSSTRKTLMVPVPSGLLVGRVLGAVGCSVMVPSPRACSGIARCTSVPSPVCCAGGPCRRAVRIRPCTESARPCRSSGTPSGSKPAPRSRTNRLTASSSDLDVHRRPRTTPACFAAFTIASRAGEHERAQVVVERAVVADDDGRDGHGVGVLDLARDARDRGRESVVERRAVPPRA